MIRSLGNRIFQPCAELCAGVQEHLADVRVSPDGRRHQRGLASRCLVLLGFVLLGTVLRAGLQEELANLHMAEESRGVERSSAVLVLGLELHDAVQKELANLRMSAVRLS